MKKSERIKLAKSNKTYLELKRVAEKYGYECDGASRTYYGDIQVSLYVKDKYNLNKRNFLCDMYLRTDLDFTKKEDCCKGYYWEMSTTSYGSLSGDELEEYFKGITNSKAFYDELKNIDLFQLTKQLKEYDEE